LYGYVDGEVELRLADGVGGVPQILKPEAMRTLNVAEEIAVECLTSC
jgi:hypothetical protein